MQDKFAARIKPLETFAEANPGLYRLRVALLALLGYAYLLAVVLLLLGIVAATLIYVAFNFLIIKILWIPLVIAGLILRSLWITLPEPDGKELRREQAPALFDLINEVSKALNGPKVHRVLLSDEFNAGIVQIPQFGMFGWLRNYLVVGLPLMRALSPAEFRAVLAHEFGHLSGKHGRFSGWIYRVRKSWIQILIRVRQERSYASFLFEPFLKWYAPFLDAYSFVLARAQEREADKYSVDLAGKQTAALALTRMMTKQRALTEEFWPNFFRGAKEQSLAPKDPFGQMLTGLDHSIGHAKAQRWFIEALRMPTGYEDTHPALGDRLAAIGFQKDGPELADLIDAVVKADEAKESAAAHYLRELPEDFLPRTNRLWREQMIRHWEDRHAELRKAKTRFTELDELAATRALTVEELWEKATLLSEIEDQSATLPIVEAILKENPDHVAARWALGAILLEQKNPDGIAHLEKVIETSPPLAMVASQAISGYYLEIGNHEMSEVFRKRAQECYEKERKLEEQATKFSANDKFVSHDLDEHVVKQLQDQLAKIRGLALAYLVGKVRDGSEQLLYVLAVSAGFTWQNGRNEKHVDALFDQLSRVTGLPSPITILSLDGEHAYLLKRISRIPRAELFATTDAGVTYLH